MIQPCLKDCPRRSAECRSTCLEWAKWERFKKELYARREQENVVRNYACESSDRIKRKSFNKRKK